MSEKTITPELTAKYWEAVRDRDKAFEGQFLFGVITTGIFCKPGCASRIPKPENVRFFLSANEAQLAGFRACKRCEPLAAETSTHEKTIADICRFIEEHSDSPLSLEKLAKQANMSQFHFQRVFKSLIGVSPKQFIDQVRINSFKTALREEGADVTSAIFDAGYGSISRLYEKLDSHLGMTPMEYRAGGAGVKISYASSLTPLGLLMIGATDRGICFIQFGESEHELVTGLKGQYPRAELQPMGKSELFDEWMTELNAYLSGVRKNLSLPLHVRATSFQLLVWRHLQSIPAGEVESYSEVAERIGRPGAARAVARACASNSVALAIPCHRVIRGTGELGGYRWGLGRKRALLDLEKQNDAGRR